MSRIKTVTGALVLGLLFSGMLAGQDKTATDKKTTDKKPGKKTKGRLPNHYGKLDLKDDQKEKILAIKADYAPRIKALADQLKALRNKQKAEYEKVLTPEQRDKLHSLVSAKKKDKKPSSSKDKKKKARKKKKASKDSTAKDDKTDQ
jgi:Spy/CpxP family protein refolding chaperone